MQIAKIVPKIKTKGDGIFDYAIPPKLLPLIKIGLLVQVPFRGQKIEGVIVEIKKKSNLDKLKPILDVIDPVPVIDSTHLELAKWMSKYYLCPLSKAIFEHVVPPAKRTIKKQAETILLQTNSVKTTSKEYLLVSDFPTRLRFYLKAIQKTLVKNQTAIILLPDLSLEKYITKYLPEKYSLFHAGLTHTDRWLAWNKIRQGETRIVVGSISALFSPLNNLGLIIVEQEEAEAYKNGQSPRFHAVKTAQALAKITNANLILGSTTPRIETFYQATKKGSLLYKLKNNTLVSIVDMNFEKEVLSLPLVNAIEKNLTKQNKIMLVLNRQGEGKYFKCNDCEWKQTCPECALPLKPNKNIGYCSNCEKNFPLSANCPNCKSKNLIIVGLSVNKLAKIVQEKWPQRRVSTLQKNNGNLEKDWEIAIVTNFALKQTFPNIGLIGLVDADQDINFPDYTSSETAFQKSFRFLRIAQEGIIQTHQPENEIIKALGKMDYKFFYDQELENRLASHFPPFTKLIRLVFKDKSKEKAQLESKKLAELLEKTAHNTDITIIGPSSPYFAKRRDWYLQQIIIKYHNLPKEIKLLLDNLSSNWIIDVDPFDLL